MENRWQELIDAQVVASQYFRMFEFKVRRCPWDKPHDWTQCPFAHPTEKAKRRDPTKYKYNGTACADFRKNGFCRRGDACPFAHGVFEAWLHPARFRTKMCTDAGRCGRHVCFFAHSPEELREPTPEDLMLIQKLQHTLEAELRCNTDFAAQLDKLHTALAEAAELQKVRVAMQRQQSGASDILELLQFADSLGLLGVRPSTNLDSSSTNALVALLLQNLQPAQPCMAPGLAGIDAYTLANALSSKQSQAFTPPVLSGSDSIALAALNGVDPNLLALNNANLSLSGRLPSSTQPSSIEQSMNGLNDNSAAQQWLTSVGDLTAAAQLPAFHSLLAQQSDTVLAPTSSAVAKNASYAAQMPHNMPGAPKLPELPVAASIAELPALPQLEIPLPSITPNVNYVQAAPATDPGSFPAASMAFQMPHFPPGPVQTEPRDIVHATDSLSKAPSARSRALNASAAAFVSARSTDPAKAWLDSRLISNGAPRNGLRQDSCSTDSLGALSPTPPGPLDAAQQASMHSVRKGPVANGRLIAQGMASSAPHSREVPKYMPFAHNKILAEAAAAAAATAPKAAAAAAGVSSTAPILQRNQSVDKMFSDLPRDIHELK